MLFQSLVQDRQLTSEGEAAIQTSRADAYPRFILPGYSVNVKCISQIGHCRQSNLTLALGL